MCFCHLLSSTFSLQVTVSFPEKTLWACEMSPLSLWELMVFVDLGTIFFPLILIKLLKWKENEMEAPVSFTPERLEGHCQEGFATWAFTWDKSGQPAPRYRAHHHSHITSSSPLESILGIICLSDYSPSSLEEYHEVTGETNGWDLCWYRIASQFLGDGND
jgi:hypothetical protein